MPNQNEIIIGAARVEYGGLELGYTTEDGVRITPEVTATEFTPSQSMGIPAVHRSRVRTTAGATFHQLTLEKLRLLQGFKNPPTGTNPAVLEATVDPEPEVLPLIITAPGPNKSTRVYMANASVISGGETVYNNNEYAGMETEFLLMTDPANDRAYTLYEYPIATDVPEVTGYNTVLPDGTTTTLSPEDTGVPVDARIQSVWNTGIRADQLDMGKFYLRNTATGLLIPAAVIYGQTGGSYDYVKINVMPQEELAAATEYELVVAPYVRSFLGAQSVQPYGLTFTTA